MRDPTELSARSPPDSLVIDSKITVPIRAGRLNVKFEPRLTRTDYTVSIDFGDFERANGDDSAKESYSVGLVTIHEFDHRTYGASDDPNSATDPGPLERTYINPIRQELGLPERVNYVSGPVDAAFKNFYPGGGQQINFKLNGKTKVIRWRKDLVGGKVKD